MNKDSILELLKSGGISAALIAILLYFGTSLIGKLDELQKDLVSIRMELTTMKATLLPREDVERLIGERVSTQIQAHELKYHK